MSRRATPLLIEDIWEAVEKIERYVSGLNHDAFVKDDKTVDSVVRNLEVIGEAANRVMWRLCGRSSRKTCRFSKRSFRQSATIKYSSMCP